MHFVPKGEIGKNGFRVGIITISILCFAFLLIVELLYDYQVIRFLAWAGFILTVWLWICLWSKRLAAMDRSILLFVVPFLITLVYLVGTPSIFPIGIGLLSIALYFVGLVIIQLVIEHFLKSSATVKD